MDSSESKSNFLFRSLKKMVGEQAITDEGVFNEASFEMPQSARNAKDINNLVNNTAPNYHSVKNTQHNFEFADDIEDKVFENDSLPKPTFKKKYEDKKEVISPTSQQLPQPQMLSQPIQGFDEIINQQSSEKQSDLVIHKKGELICQEQGLFIIKKNSKKYQSFLDYIIGESTRKIFIENSYIYFLQDKGNNQYRICSATNLEILFKIFAKSNQKKPLVKLAFFNDKKSIYLLPKVKSFSLTSPEQQNKFFIKLRTELQKIGKDLQFIKK